MGVWANQGANTKHDVHLHTGDKMEEYTEIEFTAEEEVAFNQWCEDWAKENSLDTDRYFNLAHGIE